MLNNILPQVKKGKLNAFFNIKNKTRIFLSLFFFLLLIGLASSPSIYIASTLNGIIVFGTIILPNLLPFFIFTNLLTSLQVVNEFSKVLSPITKFLFNAPAVSCYIFFMSIISGYPLGAKLILECYKEGLISKSEAQKISTFTSNSGPMFILGTVGSGMLNSRVAGLVIFISHILGSILNGIFYRNFDASNLKDNVLEKKEANLNNIFQTSLYNSIESLLLIGGYIALFFTIIELFNYYNVFNFIVSIFSPLLNLLHLDENLVNALLQGFLEVTKGCLNIKNLGLSLQLSVVFCTGLISFGGICVYFQALNFLGECEIKKGRYFVQKITHMLFSVLVACILIFGFKMI